MTNFYKKYLLLSATVLTYMPGVYAGSPVWTFTPLTATTLAVSSTETATVQYTLTNQSRKTHVLTLVPRAGLVQNTSAGNCPASAVLGFQESCTLTINVVGSALPGNIVGGPKVCEQGNTLQCYQPSAANSLNITLTSGGHQDLAAYSLVAGGGYSSLITSYPLLVVSTNSGTTWAYATPTLPSDYYNSGYFNGASCSGQNCIAAGQYYIDGSGILYPLLATSTDGGSNWAYTIDASDFTSGGAGLNSTNCTGDNCLVGGYSFITGTQYPLLGRSTNGGLSWIYPIEGASTTPLPSDYSAGGSFYSTNCSGDLCVTAGTYFGAAQYPLLALSTNGGVSWVYAIDSTTPSLPINYQGSGRFNGSSCSGNTCVAVGTYVSSSGGIAYPLLAQSTNTGATWSYVAPTLPSNYNDSGNFATTSCSGQNCIAAGQYALSSGIYYPFLAASTDGGSSWAYQIDASSYNFPGNFLSTSCNGDDCLVAGYSIIASKQYPLIGKSTDGGLTWVYPVEGSSTTSLPLDYNDGGLINSMSCKGLYCIAAGTYYALNGHQYPLLALSTDGGLSWVYTVDSVTPTLPLDFDNSGYFNGSGSGLHL